MATSHIEQGVIKSILLGGKPLLLNLSVAVRCCKVFIPG